MKGEPTTATAAVQTPEKKSMTHHATLDLLPCHSSVRARRNHQFPIRGEYFRPHVCQSRLERNRNWNLNDVPKTAPPFSLPYFVIDSNLKSVDLNWTLLIPRVWHSRWKSNDAANVDWLSLRSTGIHQARSFSTSIGFPIECVRFYCIRVHWADRDGSSRSTVKFEYSKSQITQRPDDNNEQIIFVHIR